MIPPRRHNGAERMPSSDKAHHRKVTASGMTCAIIVLPGYTHNQLPKQEKILRRWSLEHTTERETLAAPLVCSLAGFSHWSGR
jgi:hypothetical protein